MTTQMKALDESILMALFVLVLKRVNFLAIFCLFGQRNIFTINSLFKIGYWQQSLFKNRETGTDIKCLFKVFHRTNPLVLHSFLTNQRTARRQRYFWHDVNIKNSFEHPLKLFECLVEFSQACLIFEIKIMWLLFTKR